MSNLIRRQDAIDVVAKFYKYESDRMTALQELPTVEAKPVMTGEWMKSETGVYICSKCNNGYKNQPTCMGHPMFEYCPMCGAKMKGADMRGGKNEDNI